MNQEALQSVAEGVLGQRSVLLIFGIGIVLFCSAGWLLAVWRSWHRAFTVLAAVGLALAFAVTQGRQPFQFEELSLSGCALTSVDSGFSEMMLNVGMLVPLAVFAVLATGRIVAPALLCVVTSVVLEALQGLFGTGFCVGQDAVSNCVGGVCAAVITGLVTSHRRRRLEHAA